MSARERLDLAEELPTQEAVVRDQVGPDRAGLLDRVDLLDRVGLLDRVERAGTTRILARLVREACGSAR